MSSSQKFTGGELSWNRASKEFTTVPPDLAGQLAGLSHPRGRHLGDQRCQAGGRWAHWVRSAPNRASQYAIGKDGAGQDFAGGKIFYSPATGANVVSGQVLKKYESVGGPQSDLGFPSSNEADGGLKTGSRVSTFSAKDKPVIFWTPDYGAFIVRGAMNAAWEKLGGAAGSLGPPVADQSENGNVVTQRFTGGEVSWDKKTNKFSTQPANLASGLAGLSVPGYEPPQCVERRRVRFQRAQLVYAVMVVAARRNSAAGVGGPGRGRDTAEPGRATTWIALDAPFDVDTTHDTAAEAEALRLEDSDAMPASGWPRVTAGHQVLRGTDWAGWTEIRSNVRR